MSNMKSPFLKELIEFGLSEKAARVYLASLELGPSPVQLIAKKADVNRPTAYVMIEALSSRGLMSSFEKGKKRYFSAENPEHLLVLLDSERESVKTKEGSIKKILPELKKFADYFSDRPGVSFYEGLDGIAALREDVIRSGEKELLELVPIDEAKKYIQEEASDDLKGEIHKKVKIKSVYTTHHGPVLKEKNGAIESRYISTENLNLGCEIIVYGDKTAFFAYSGKPNGVMVHSKEIAQTMKSLFDLTWREAERQKIKNNG